MAVKKLLNTKKTLSVQGHDYTYYSLAAAEAMGLSGISRLPFSLKILLENQLRHHDGQIVTDDDLQAFADWRQHHSSERAIGYFPARVLMQDFTGVPAVVDLASMRDAMVKLGGDPQKINPLIPVDLVVDHSVQVDNFGSNTALQQNIDIEMQRNGERYAFLRWGQTAFKNFSVVPPGNGICHQVNLEYLAKCIWTQTQDNQLIAYPDTLVGTDSHTTMVNALGVLGWGVGGIEAEAAMLGQPYSMLIPQVIGVKLSGRLNPGITATDLVLTVTEILRKYGVVEKFVEFFGPGLEHLSLADRATTANMAPEYGATCGFFPIDQETLRYLQLTGRDTNTIALTEAYCKIQGLWRDETTPDPEFTHVLHLDLSTIEPSLAGPKRPQDRVTFSQLPIASKCLLDDAKREEEIDRSFSCDGESFELKHCDIVIAAITSCTNTSNPSVLLTAGLLAKNAIQRGLTTKPWVKTSLAPGSKVVTEYLEKTGLQKYLDKLGFYVVGYGCTTCIGNSGPLSPSIQKTISENDAIVSAVLSGNRNFEGRIHPAVKANWLASPPLVVALALAGTTLINLAKDPLGADDQGKPIYLKDIWPNPEEIQQAISKITNKMFKSQYANIFRGDKTWEKIPIHSSSTYDWDKDSTYVQHPPFFNGLTATTIDTTDIKGGRLLALLGDSITTDHISPAGSIKKDGSAGTFLLKNGITIDDFNSYGARRGNHEVMMRGTFANIRIRNEMVPGVEGGFTKHYPSNETLSIYDAAMRYQGEHVPTVVIAGKEYGTGSSRDWAAKGPALLGVRAVIAESFERIHRSNLIGMGVLPLQFPVNINRKTLSLNGSETIDILGLDNNIHPSMSIKVIIHRQTGGSETITVTARLDTQNEVLYYQNGGILPFVLRKMVNG